MAENQIHYKTLRGKATEEYQDALGAKSYVEALLGRDINGKEEDLDISNNEGCKLVRTRETRAAHRKISWKLSL